MQSAPVLRTGASTVSGDVDLLFTAITLVAIFFSVGIFIAITFLAVRYRQGARVDRSNPPQYNHIVESVWTLGPLLIALGIFAWAAYLYFGITRVPRGAMEIYVVGKQWMWKLQQPGGRWEMNELHVPVGKPVVLTMTSEDVIHSFYVPAFRLKQDVIPGRFTQMWFTPTKPGAYHLFCAEFCGTLHSGMVGTVYVMDQADYEKWLAEGNVRETAASRGAVLFRKHGCSGCHGAGASVRAPALEGIYGKSVAVQVRRSGVPLEQTPATTITADTRYIHDSIVLPEKEVAAGYRPIMPSFKNQLTEEEILNLVAYIRSLSDRHAPAAGRQDFSGRLGPEDYRARTGFVPRPLPSGAREPAPRGGANQPLGAAAIPGTGNADRETAGQADNASTRQ